MRNVCSFVRLPLHHPKITASGEETETDQADLYKGTELNGIIRKYVMKREGLLSERSSLYQKQEAIENDINIPLDDLVEGATGKIVEFNEKCFENSSKFEGSFTRGLCHGDLNWKNILKDQEDQIWIIDFPAAEVKLVLHDLAKAISCTMFELTKALTLEMKLLDQCMHISTAIANAASLADDLLLPTELGSPEKRVKLENELEPTWHAVRQLWACCKSYCIGENYSTAQLLLPLLAFAIKTQCWIQYTPIQRKWALQSALLYIEALDKPHDAVEINNGREGNGGQQDETAAEGGDSRYEDMQLAVTNYTNHIKHTCGYTVDPITQKRIDIFESFVPLNVLQSDEIKELLAQNIDLDKQAQRDMLNDRTNKARGASVDLNPKGYPAVDAIKFLMPSDASDASDDTSTQGHSETVQKPIQCCLLG